MYNPKLHFHFTGIGGAGMSGLAEILLNLGYTVSGTDLKMSSTTVRLEELGARIAVGHDAAHLPAEASLLVYSSAVRFDNVEIVEALRRGIPVIRRAEVLAELMRMKFGVGVAGSHGKTTTTSMTAAILERGGLDPTVIIGGQVKSMHSGGKLGRSQYLVAETDESDRSFLLLKPTIAVVTNIDAEHMNAYSSLADLEESFEKFINAVPFYGVAVLCVDDAKVRDLAQRYRGRKLTYGLSLDAQIRAANLSFSRTSSDYDLYRDNILLGRISLPMLGRHMVVNSLAAIAVGFEFGIPFTTVVESLADFSGVRRRLEVIGECCGVTVINDYGHHPAEVRATLAAIRAAWGTDLGRLRVIFQPHRYSRTRDCFVEFIDAFKDADELFMLEIYAASEDPLAGISGAALCEAVAHPCRTFVADLGAVVDRVLEDYRPGDVVLCLGAGSVGSLADSIVSRLSEFQSGVSAALAAEPAALVANRDRG